MLLPTLNNERIMVGSFCLGVIDGILEDALEYMKQRHAFGKPIRSEEHTSELQSLMRISYAVFCLKKKTNTKNLNTLTIENICSQTRTQIKNNSIILTTQDYS